MSFLQIPTGIPDFSKAVISFWFQVSQETMDAVYNEWLAFVEATVGDPYRTFPRMLGVVPLLTFGPMFDGYYIKADPGANYTYIETKANFSGGGFVILETVEHTQPGASVFSATSKILSNPSHIGLSVNKDHETGVVVAYLHMRIQMNDNGSGSWVNILGDFKTSDYTQLYGVTDPPCPQDTAWDFDIHADRMDGAFPGGERTSRGEYKDLTELHARRFGPEAFEAGGGSGLVVAPDTWHHVLISCDLGHAMTGKGRRHIGDQMTGQTVSDEDVRAVTDPCQVWIALDDKNYIGDDIFYNNRSEEQPEGYVAGIGPNGVVPQNIYDAAVGVNSAGAFVRYWALSGLIAVDLANNNFGLPTYSYNPQPVPSGGHPFGIPCVAGLVDSVRHCEMAEFQMWTGITLDTGVVINRRAFIDYELDSDGNRTTNMKPVDPKKAAELLGKKPEILLHGSGNWIKGKNTGTIGVTSADPPQEIPEGQFIPTGGIKRYKPDPSLQK
jgi:hypothetical protein